jgi:hypothetical protein
MPKCELAVVDSSLLLQQRLSRDRQSSLESPICWGAFSSVVLCHGGISYDGRRSQGPPLSGLPTNSHWPEPWAIPFAQPLARSSGHDRPVAWHASEAE